MLFNSNLFIYIFLPIVFIVFYLFGRLEDKRYATGWLVVSSLFFYGYWDYKYIPLLLMSIFFNYMAGKIIYVAESRKKLALILAIMVNITLLGYFKYVDFFAINANLLLGEDFFELHHIILPLGISFFTFTQIAYLIDIYRREIKSDSILYYLEFVTIFPHLIAGPIISYKEMLSQFKAKETFRINSTNVALGFTIFAIGLFKKVVIADSLSLWSVSVFSDTRSLTFLSSWAGALSYSFQLYFDFSGYSEMAIGLGLLFNLHLPINFNSPYKAKSIIDFWRRWHMTLGNWVKNYLYIPMGGNRCGLIRQMRNLIVSMLLIGFWHGAGWTFVFWGGIHGILLVINNLWRKLNIDLPSWICWSLTFISVVVCWVFFKANDIGTAINILSAMIDIRNTGLPDAGIIGRNLSFLKDYGIGFSAWRLSSSFVVVYAYIFLLLILVLYLPNPLIILQNKDFIRRSYLVPIIIGILLGYSLLSMNVGTSEFLYFQF